MAKRAHEASFDLHNCIARMAAAGSTVKEFYGLHEMGGVCGSLCIFTHWTEYMSILEKSRAGRSKTGSSTRK